MAEKTVKCRECGWDGLRSMLELYRCPRCDSRRLQTEGTPLSQDDNLNPPEDAEEGEDVSAA